MTSHTPPIPTANRNKKDLGSNAAKMQDQSLKLAEPQNTSEQGNTANIRQNTTNKGFFQGRRLKWSAHARQGNTDAIDLRHWRAAFEDWPEEGFVMAKLNADDRDKLPARDFAEPEKRAYPIEDKAHARNAKARASQAVNSGRMSKAEEDKIDQKADAVLK
jgi:hypothetical protein